MIGTLFVGCIISILIVAAAAYLLLRVVRQELARIQGQQQHWAQTYEVQQQYWRASQEKRLSDLEHRLSAQIQEFQVAQKTREVAENQRFDALINQYENTSAKARLEYELLQLPRVEDIPLPGQDQRDKPGLASRYTPPNLQGEDLSGRDLSSRYLSHADLRNIKLARAKLFMADLSWANLAGADLSEAELSAANLTYSNLRGATLRGANFLVADLQHAILIGADLRDAHSLSLEQVKTTLYDASTQFDPDIANQLPQKKRSQQLTDHDPMPTRAEDTMRMPALRKSQELQTPTGDVLALQLAAISSRDQVPLEQPVKDEIQPSESVASEIQIAVSEAPHTVATPSEESSPPVAPVDSETSLETLPAPEANSPSAISAEEELVEYSPVATPAPKDDLLAEYSIVPASKDALLADNETAYNIVPFLPKTSEESFQDKELSEREETRTPELADSN